MVYEKNNRPSHVVAFMDLGTNSVRLLLVRIHPNYSYSVLTQQKEVVRLGGGEFPRRQLRRDAMTRAVTVCKHFVQMAKQYGATEIIAVATSASRDADNREEFLDRLRKEAGLDVRVISGKEEARLIYLGVSRGLQLCGKLAAFIDIGGGSTEIAVGDGRRYRYLDSLKLGAIRLTSMFFRPGDTGKVSAQKYAEICQYVGNAAVLTVSRVKKFSVEQLIGSSGTIMNLAEIALRNFHGRPLQRNDSITHAELKRTIRLLCGLPLEQRRKVDGINPERADIIIAGAAIVDTLMAKLGLKEITISDRSLRNGMLVNYLLRTGHRQLLDQLSVRERSVLLLGRSCGFDEPHAQQVAGLAEQLFDATRKAGLHSLGPAQRELLHYAAMLHDIGVFLSFVNHQDHTYYLIRNSDLLGFDEMEIATIATLARFHRKGWPSAKYPQVAELDKATRKMLPPLTALLRLAESLDRSHAGRVRKVTVKAAGKARATLELKCSGDCQLELWGVQNHLKYFHRAFGRQLVVKRGRKVISE